MKTRKKIMAVLAAAFILPCSFPAYAAEAGRMPEEAVSGQENALVPSGRITGGASLSEMATVSGNKAESAPEDGTGSMPQQEAASTAEYKPDGILPTEPVSTAEEEAPKETSLPENTIPPEDGTGFPVPSEAPAFHACIKFLMGYTVIGTFTDFTPDIIRIQTLYSLDGENWQASARDWNVSNLDTDDEEKLKGLQNQPCLFNADEPLKSYIAGETDLFYVKLRITRKSGISYETQPAAIERGGLQPIPEGTECRAIFSSAIAAREPDLAIPYRYRKYGRYELTIHADATAEDVTALLPDTLPVEVQLDNGSDFKAIGVVDCPVTWKPLSLPQLSAGESITIPDAAEEILVPGGTLVSTPLGVFQLDEPLSLDTFPSTDEVRLVLNVTQEDKTPTGVLREGKNGLEIAFRHKPTGTVSIQAYALAEGESKWTRLFRILPEELNQPSTANSGYAVVLRNDQEPYRSYLAATDAGTTPTPFFISLEIKGGVYDGQQLILAWPDTYEQLPDLPDVRGAEGNEGNAGAGNKSDSTESGQRPNLPQIPEDNQEGQHPNPAPGPDGKQDGQQANPAPDSDSKQDGQLQNTAPGPDGRQDGQLQNTAPGSDGRQEEQQQNPVPGSNGRQDGQLQNTAPAPDGKQDGQLPKPSPDNSDNTGADNKDNSTDSRQYQNSALAKGNSTSNKDGSTDGGQHPNLPQIPDGNHEKQLPTPEPDTSGQKQQAHPSHTPGTAPAAPKGQDASPTGRSSADYQPGRQGNQLFSQQRQNLPQTTPDASGISAAPQGDSPKHAALTAQTEAGIKEKAGIPALPDAEAIGHTAENSRHIPLLPVTTSIAAGICIAAAVCKSAGYSLFHRISAKIRNILHK